MKKNTYFVVTLEKDGKFFAEVWRICNSNNLVHKFNFPGIYSINVADTKREAYEVAENWNVGWKRDGKLLSVDELCCVGLTV